MNIGPYCHFAQRDGVRAVFRQDGLNLVLCLELCLQHLSLSLRLTAPCKYI